MHSTPRIALSDLSVCGCVGGGRRVKRCERIVREEERRSIMNTNSTSFCGKSL